MHNVMLERLEPRRLVFIFLATCFVYIMLCGTQSFNGLSKSRSVLDEEMGPFAFKIVHFDLKGAPLKLSYFSQIFPLLKSLNICGILMEYEDMFPYSGKLEVLRRKNAYSALELESILKMANDSDLEVIPLVQTFGHMEFVLKNEIYSDLREISVYTDTICPSDNRSYLLIKEMISQIRSMHPTSKIIHIGADEALHIANDYRCINRLRNPSFTVDDLKLDHISRVARLAKEVGFKDVMAWNDMFANISSKLLLKYEMNKLIIPIIWGYATDVTTFGYFPPGMFARFSEVFDNMFFGSAFKGANGIRNIFIDINRYLKNHRSYNRLYNMNKPYLEGKLNGIVITGWQRYNHFAPLCELFPAAIPSLAVNALYLDDTSSKLEDLVHRAKTILKCTNSNADQNSVSDYSYPSLEASFSTCSFAGRDVYVLIEKLRLLQRNVDDFLGEDDNKYVLLKELSVIKAELRSAMQPFFYDDTIDEFINDNVISLVSALTQPTSTSHN